MAIKTAKAEHRRLRFKTLADARLELDNLERAHRAGTLRTTGNWTPGQNLAHIAAFIRYAYEGYPPELQSPPWILKVIARLFKRQLLNTPLMRGVNIGKIPGGTVGAVEMPFDEAVSLLRGQYDRLQFTEPKVANPLLGVGNLTHEEWIKMHLRHSELHLGYLQPV
jgi:hypothetical protein